MSKGPSPRVDQIRALREARFARNVAREKEAERAEKPAVTAPIMKPAAAEEPVKAAKPAAAKAAPAKRAKKTPVKKVKKKSGKPKKAGK